IEARARAAPQRRKVPDERGDFRLQFFVTLPGAARGEFEEGGGTFGHGRENSNRDPEVYVGVSAVLLFAVLQQAAGIEVVVTGAGAPIADAQVVVAGQTSRTGTDGRVTI